MSISNSPNHATISVTEFSLVNASTSLAASTTPVILQGFVDFSNMAAGDQYQVKIKDKINGGAQKVLYTSVVTGLQSEAQVLPSLVLMEGWDVTVTKLAGTDRDIIWSLRQVA